MYKIFFNIYQGLNNSPRKYFAGDADSLEEAIDLAQKCYGWVEYPLNNIIKNYSKY